MKSNQINNERWKSLVSQIKSEAEKRGFSQSEIAELTGIKQANISRVLAGKCKSRIDILDAIAQAIGLEIKIK